MKKIISVFASIILVFAFMTIVCKVETPETAVNESAVDETVVDETSADTEIDTSETLQIVISGPSEESVITIQESESGSETGLFSHAQWNGTDAYMIVNNNRPYFLDEGVIHYDHENDEYTVSCEPEYYSELDELGRCGETYALVSRDIMPTEPRGSIGEVHPTGWHTVRYDDLISDHYLYNRCHLIGYQLAGENANPLNLITGTRYLNIEGMLPFENEVADYIDAHGSNRVLYRVTPIFENDNLVAEGVLMEGYSVEDNGQGVCFCVFAFNVQPGIEIDYATGESWRTSEPVPVITEDPHSLENAQYPEYQIENEETTYILNINSMRFHRPDCSAVDQMSEQNRQESTSTREELIAEGYTPCGICEP